MTTFTAILRNGETATRNSGSKNFAFAVEVRNPETEEIFVWRWSETEKAAISGKRDAARYGFHDSRIIPVA